MPLYAIGERSPQIDPAAFVHPDAVVIGDVVIGPESTVWPTAVLRGDHGRIVVGSQTSVQDGTVVQQDPSGGKAKPGSKVTIGVGSFTPPPETTPSTGGGTP